MSAVSDLLEKLSAAEASIKTERALQNELITKLNIALTTYLASKIIYGICCSNKRYSPYIAELHLTCPTKECISTFRSEIEDAQIVVKFADELSFEQKKSLVEKRYWRFEKYN